MIRRSFTWAIAAVATTATLGCPQASSKPTAEPAPASSAPSGSYPGLSIAATQFQQPEDRTSQSMRARVARLAAVDPVSPERMTELTRAIDAFVAARCTLVPLGGARVGLEHAECHDLLRAIDSDDVATVHALGAWVFAHPSATGEAACPRSAFDVVALGPGALGAAERERDPGRCLATSPAGSVFLLLVAPRLETVTSTVPLRLPPVCVGGNPHEGCRELRQGALAAPPYYASPGRGETAWLERLPNAGLALSYAAIAAAVAPSSTIMSDESALTYAGGFEPYGGEHRDIYRWLVFMQGKHAYDGPALERAMRRAVELGLASNAIAHFAWAVEMRFARVPSVEWGTDTDAARAAARDRGLAFLRVAHGNAGTAVERKLSLLRTLAADEVLTGSDLATLESWLGREQSRVYERGS